MAAARPRPRRRSAAAPAALLISALVIGLQPPAGQLPEPAAPTASAHIDATLTGLIVEEEPGALSLPGAADGESTAAGIDEGAERSGAAADNAWVDTQSGTAEILVLFRDAGVPEAAQGTPELAAAALQDQAEDRWARVDAQLDRLERNGTITVLNRFWVTSAVLVSAVPGSATLAALAALPGATEVIPNYTVEGLDQEPATELAAPSVPAESSAAEQTPATYGIEKIRAREAWADFGAEGQGVRVAVLDTGIDATHPDLRDRLVGRDLGDPTYPGGWINFDRTGSPVVSTPTDPGSHGTHVAGTILGGDASGTQIGVAPQAELMAANVLSGNGGGSAARILAALEWVMAPYDGNGEPTGRAADVINMSLGSSGYDETFITPIRNLRQAGIFPAIAIGNAPCGLNGTSNPGDIYEAFGVGMTDSEDLVDAGSCGAVTDWPASTAQKYGWPEAFVKPDASAPGVKVFSSMPGGKWGESTGTSMATPHVAGAVALIRSAQAGLSIDQIEAALEDTAWRPDPGGAPDTRYGSGRIDVHAAISAVRGESGVIGTVVDATSGTPVAGAEVSYGDHGETWTTDAAGRFIARLAPGDYSFTVTRFGYAPLPGLTITVPPDVFQQTTVPLTPITVGSIAGVVVDHSTGQPVADATVGLLGQPVQVRTAADGSYRIADIPIGEYQIRVSADGARTATSAAAPVQAALETTVNFRLARLPSVLVLGDNGGRTATLLTENGLAAAHADDLPAVLGELAHYDAVVWDSPQTVDEAQLRAAIAATDASGTGIVWLDLGADDTTGIARLHTLLGIPTSRETANDRTLTATGYRILQSHEILQGGTLSPDPLAEGALLRQNTSSGGPKFTAWFDGLSGREVTVLADAVGIRGDGAEQQVETLGSGIAVDQREQNRHVYLSLHGSSTAVDASSWSAASQQLLVNAVSWAAPATAQAPDPEIILPAPPVVVPGDGGNPGTTTTTTTSGTGSPVTATARSRAPAAQSAPKPELTPPLPVASTNLLTAANSGGITARIADGIAYIRIPDANPGDWFFLHVYPQKTAVEWIRVNDDGELRIDIARLRSGEYRFAFTSAEGRFVGWVSVQVAGQDAAEQEPEVAESAVAQTVQAPASAGFTLSTAEILMLLGAALIILAAAGVVLLGLRRPAAPAGSDAGDGPAPGAET